MNVVREAECEKDNMPVLTLFPFEMLSLDALRLVALPVAGYSRPMISRKHNLFLLLPPEQLPTIHPVPIKI